MKPIVLLQILYLQRVAFAFAPVAISPRKLGCTCASGISLVPIVPYRYRSLNSGSVSINPFQLFHTERTICQMQSMVDIFGSILGANVDGRNLRKERQKRKDALLSLLNPTDSKSGRIVVVKRSEDIDAAIDTLAEVSPTEKADDIAKKLERTWSLIWTTEKEINFFIEQGWSTNITQQILIDDTTLINTIPFVNDNGSFGVRGRIFRQEEDPAIRTQFVFETAVLRWRWLPELQFPPVGQGWFDTVYLDDDFRVDRNSRNDILVCRSMEER
jgi:PAP_fibrillin